MSRKSAFVQKIAARRNAREFQRALRSAPPTMQQELRAIAARSQVGNL